MHHRLRVTLVLLAALGAVFLRGFREAIWLAVVLVVVYLALNVVVVGYELVRLWQHPTAIADWRATCSRSSRIR